MSWLLSPLRMRVFRKVFIGFLVVLLPLTAINSAVLWISSHAMASQAQASTHSKLQFFMDYLQEELRNVNQMLVALSNDPDLPSAYLYQEGVFDYELVHLSAQIQSKMKIVLYSSDYVSDVFLILPEIREQLSAGEGLRELSDSLSKVLSRHTEQGNQIARYIDDQTITYSTSVTDGSGDNILYVLGTEISQQRIIEAMNRFNENNQYHVFLVDDHTGKIISNGTSVTRDKYMYERMVQSDSTGVISFDHTNYLVQRSTDENFTLISYVSERDVIAPVFNMRNVFLLLVTSLVLFSIIYSRIVYNQIHKPLHRLVQTMREVEIGNMNVSLQIHKEDEFGYVYKQFNKMIDQLRSLIQEVLESKIQTQQAQLKQLQSQINPHFLFNCFYIGYRMAKAGESENVARLCKYLGDYFRFVTQQAPHEVMLRDELKYTVTYLEIQKMRFTDRLSYTLNVDPELELVAVPGLILQPLVENALLHGIERVDRPGHIVIEVRQENGILIIEVEDNGSGMDSTDLMALSGQLDKPTNVSDNCGLWNVHWRLKHRYGQQWGLVLQNRVPEGFSACITLPLVHPSQQEVDQIV
ncbi:histidine kinase [Paenibacillus sp. GCM10023252]|uniref:sensor histidine kinase n=1 Tax=Paenibacillus sp. GCM10023252 TaxID=3252649 RepID=UPI0036099418